MADHDLRATQVVTEYDASVDHDLRATQVLVEYDRSVDHQLRATQVLVEYDWLEPEPENNVPAAMMHYQRIRRAG